MRKVIFIFWTSLCTALWLVILTGLGTASAQEDNYPECEFQSTKEILIGLIQETQSWQQMEQFSRDLSESLAFCRGLIFEGSGPQVLASTHLPPGLYRLHLSGDELTTVEGVLIDGRCDASAMFIGIQAGQSELEQPFESQDCHASFNVQSTGDWMLRLEPLNVLSTEQQGGGPITYGAQVAGTLQANSVTEYVFTAMPGDVVTIGVVANENDADLYIDLFVDGGDLLASDDDSNPEGILNPQISALPLPTGGEHRIVVRHCNVCSTDTPATFTLTLQRIN